MIFNSLEFAFFLIITFALYWISPKKFRWAVLLLASYCFYMWWNWKLVFLIAGTTLVSYGTAILIERYENNTIKKLILTINLVVCFGVLLFFKYFAFFADVYYDIIGIFAGKQIHGYFDIMLPVGISFYTFQTASYVIDCYKGKIRAEKNLGYYALFVTFFPQLVAGPIERSDALMPQLRNQNHSITEVDFSGAFRYMLVGFFKKVAVADIIGIYVNAVYKDVQGATGFTSLIATLLFAVQIFCDFSGYSDIAVGCAKLFCVNLTENFKKPYSANTIKDFWNRWHISLSSWLRDYIYFPLGGSRVSKLRWILNIMVVFFVSGLWHGANYTYIIWGVLHGVFYVIGVLTFKYRKLVISKLKINPDGRFAHIVSVFVTFLIVDFCWIFFRAQSIGDAGLVISKIFTDWQFNLDYYKSGLSDLNMSIGAMIYIIVCVIGLRYIEDVKYISITNNKLMDYSWARYVTYYALCMTVCCAWIFLQQLDIESAFIYFQF